MEIMEMLLVVLVAYLLTSLLFCAALAFAARKSLHVSDMDNGSKGRPSHLEILTDTGHTSKAVFFLGSHGPSSAPDAGDEWKCGMGGSGGGTSSFLAKPADE
jgi:hypothetical protein